jgi:hypothetical protein
LKRVWDLKNRALVPFQHSLDAPVSSAFGTVLPEPSGKRLDLEHSGRDDRMRP